MNKTEEILNKTASDEKMPETEQAVQLPAGDAKTVPLTAEEQNEKKRMPTFVVIILLTLALAFVAAAVYYGPKIIKNGLIQPVQEKKFTLSGLTFTLTDEFETYTENDDTASSEYATLTVFSEDFSLIEGLDEMPLGQYLELLRDANGHSESEIKTLCGIDYYSFEKAGDDGALYYFVFTIKGENCYYTGQFCCLKENADEEMIKRFASWAAGAKEQ